MNYLYTSNNTLNLSILNLTGSQCKDLRTGVICSYVLVLLSVLYKLQLSYGVFGKASEESITIIHPAGDESMHKFL